MKNKKINNAKPTFDANMPRPDTLISHFKTNLLQEPRDSVYTIANY